MSDITPDLQIDSPKSDMSAVPGARKEAWRRRLPLLPALIFVILVTQVPFLFSLWFALTDRTLSPDTSFVGLQNYIDLISDRFFRDALWTSVVITTVSVVLSVVFGALLALLLDRKFFGKGLARTFLITPFLVTPVVASLVWANQMLHVTFGIINWLTSFVGIENIAYAERFPLSTVIVVLVWQWTPFMMLIILAGLQGQNQSILEAARVDGASPKAAFFQITLPYLRPYLELGTLLGVIYISQVFDQIDQVTGGRAGTANAPYYVYSRSVKAGNLFGYASSMSIVVVVISIIAATFGLRVLSNLFEDGEKA